MEGHDSFGHTKSTLTQQTQGCVDKLYRIQIQTKQDLTFFST